MHDDVGKSVTFHTPNAAALHLNAAWKAAARAAAIREQVRWIENTQYPIYGAGGAVIRQLHAEGVPALFDFFEEAMQTASSSFAAIEAYCNCTIVEKLSGTLQVEHRRKLTPMQAQEIEERISTRQKVRAVLPELLRCSSLEGAYVWPAFERLRGLRDSITHFKRRDQARAETTEPTALHWLLDSDPFEHPESAMAVLRHFMGEHPDRWMLNPAWTRPVTPVV